MTEPTIDPSNGLIIDLEAEVKSIGNYLGCNEDELWSEISKLISDQVAKAEERGHSIGFKNGKWAMEKVVAKEVAKAKAEAIETICEVKAQREADGKDFLTWVQFKRVVSIIDPKRSKQ